jgi:hypothetical protein
MAADALLGWICHSGAASIEGGHMSYPQYQPQPPKPDRRAMNRKILLVVAFVATALASCGVGAAVGSSTKASGVAAAPGRTDTVYVTTTVTATPVAAAATTKPAVAPKPTPKPTPPPAAKATIPDGYQVVVGQDAPAGRYETHSTSTDCYWEIDKHGTSDIVDNDAGKLGHLVITLKAGQDFSSHDCGDWTKQ